jgi:chromosome segregation ATPase
MATMELSLKKWEADKDRLAKEIARLTEDRLSLAEQVHILKKSLGQSTGVQRKLQMELAGLDSEIGRKKKEIALRDEYISRQLARVQDERSAAEKLKQFALDKEKEVSQREDKVQKLEKELDVRAKAIGEKEAKLQDKEKFLHGTEENLLKTISQLKDDGRQLSAERQLLEKMKKEAGQLELNYKLRLQQLSRKDEEQSQREARIRNMENEVQERLASMKATEEHLAKNIAHLQSVKNSMKRELGQFESKQQKNNQLLNELGAKQQDRQRELDRLSEQVMLKKRELKARLPAGAGIASEEEEATSKRVEALKQQESEAAEELRRLEQQLAASKRESARGKGSCQHSRRRAGEEIFRCTEED